MQTQEIEKWIRGDNPPSIMHSARTAIAGVLSFLAARLFHMQEAYWAPIATFIVMQSTLGAALPVSVERLVGTVLGAFAGGLAAAYWPGNILVFGIGVFTLGLVCQLLRIVRAAYRYAGITLVIVMLVPRVHAPWLIAFHRFIEVSIGLVMGLVVTAVWPERDASTKS
ncbi:MAG TPA: FUSC family protein [Terriglobales bacterium]|nr:FUSC family protein [Terriglobales bacterium]